MNWRARSGTVVRQVWRIARGLTRVAGRDGQVSHRAGVLRIELAKLELRCGPMSKYLAKGVTHRVEPFGKPAIQPARSLPVRDGGRCLLRPPDLREATGVTRDFNRDVGCRGNQLQPADRVVHNRLAHDPDVRQPPSAAAAENQRRP